MQYQIVVVSDDALTGHDWALIETDDVTVFAVKPTAMTAETMADGWGAVRYAEEHRPPPRLRLAGT